MYLLGHGGDPAEKRGIYWFAVQFYRKRGLAWAFSYEEVCKKRLSPKNRVDAAEDELQLALRELANGFSQLPFVNGDNQGDIRNRILGKTCRSCGQEYVAGCVPPLQVRREGYADNRVYPASIQCVALHDDDGPPIARA